MRPIASRYQRLAAHLTDVVAAVPADSWDDPSPCEGWSARDVLAHVVTTELDMLGRMPFAPSVAPDTTEPFTAWPLVRDLLQTALDDDATAGHGYEGYFGPTTFEATVDSFYAADLVVHAWDIARAARLGTLETIDPDEIVRVRAGFEGLSDMMRTPGIFGPEIVCAPDADEQTRFLAWLGRAS